MNPWIYSESDYEIYLKSKNITLQEDLRNRNEGFEYIRKMNEALKLYAPLLIWLIYRQFFRPLGTICTGLIYFHRFYMRHSPKKYNYKVKDVEKGFLSTC